mmetsp:Transcript_17136/g.19754  ORF Transcript_17136/g.19754 Transcript_17136/m.19754 type:complete len:86 (+) Transcript_17136:385-642(+)
MNYSLFQKVIKMDSFINIGVTAGDWIPIEECEEEIQNLILSLQQKRRDDYMIVGMKQTSSSFNMVILISSISKFQFPKRKVLLLG